MYLPIADSHKGGPEGKTFAGLTLHPPLADRIDETGNPSIQAISLGKMGYEHPIHDASI